jgi:ubiquinone/menaquinone biosynthesis C-methylase UbiE
MTLGDFTAQAEAYARSRPDYPAALVGRLVRAAGVAAGDPVAEIGAGTGMFTRRLAEYGFALTAVEPNAAMRAHAPDLPGVRWIDGTFERTGFADRSQRWVAAAQSFHWSDVPRALAEARRILRPGGALTVLWNYRQLDEPTVAWTLEAIQRVVPGFDDNYREGDWAAELLSTGHFTEVAPDEERHVVAMSKQRYLDVWQSHHRLNELAGPERFATFHAALRRHLDEHRIENIPVPYVCKAWTAR